MAKELPYFKFEPGAWDNGKIQMCCRESKALFIELCSTYWSRLGDLPYAFALHKHCNGITDALQELIKHEIISIENERIIIEFLDEQLSEFQSTSVERSKAAKKRWSDANALQLQCKSNAIREEKRREEKIREDDKKTMSLKRDVFEVPFLDGTPVRAAWDEWERFRKEKKKTLTKSTVKKQIQFLGGRGDPEIIAIINESIKNGWTGLFEIKKTTYGKNNNWRNTQGAIRRADALIEEGKDFGEF